MYIGRKPRRFVMLRSCLLLLIILIAGTYGIVLVLASRSVYVMPLALLPDKLQPTPTLTPTPTEPAPNHLERADAYFRNGAIDDAIKEY